MVEQQKLKADREARKLSKNEKKSKKTTQQAASHDEEADEKDASEVEDIASE